MTAAGAKHVASWLAGNPPLEQLFVFSKLACIDARGRCADDDMLHFGRQL